jgi:hypothetical protein
MTLPISITPNPSEPVKPITLRRVRKWGDPVMIQYGFNVNVVGTSNFQAVRSFNKETGFGAVSNFLYIPHNEVMLLRDMQFAEITERGYFDEDSKMEWLCSWRGSLYMYNSQADEWPTAKTIRWGTLTLGGNLVQVERYEVIRYVFGTNYEEKTIRDVPMARLVGFRKSDWSRPLNDLISEGLVHYCYCAYKDNGFGHSPKGVVYSPFYSPLDYDFSGNLQPDALYIPEIWLENE